MIMRRKAKIVSASPKLAKNTLVTMEIMENYLEPHFAALQEDVMSFRQEVRSDISLFRQEISEKYETTLRAILEILTGHTKQIKNIKEDSWSLDKRVTKLEKQLV